MKLKKLCDPFTGIEINVAEFDDRTFLFDKCFTHESVAVGYDATTDRYTIPASAFKLVYSVSLAEAAEILGVSKMRVSAMCGKGQLQYSKVNGIMLVSYDSIMEYRINRDKRGYKGVVKDDRSDNGNAKDYTK